MCGLKNDWLYNNYIIIIITSLTLKIKSSPSVRNVEWAIILCYVGHEYWIMKASVNEECQQNN